MREFEIETLQDWHLEAGANQEQDQEVGSGGASNSNTSNNSATEP